MQLKLRVALNPAENRSAIIKTCNASLFWPTIQSSDDCSTHNSLLLFVSNQSKGTSGKGQSTEGSGDDKGEGEGGEDEEDGSVNVAGMMGDKEEQLHLRQLVEAHQISMP